MTDPPNPSSKSRPLSRPRSEGVRHLNQIQLADRWNISHRSLERWRWIGEGPAYLKIGGRVVYRLEDIEAYEAEHLCGDALATPTSEAYSR